MSRDEAIKLMDSYVSKYTDDSFVNGATYNAVNMKDEVLISELMYQKEKLTTKQIMKALIDGYKIKLMKAPKGINYWLEDNQLKSSSIDYLKGIPTSWFNPDIHYEIDYD